MIGSQPLFPVGEIPISGEVQFWRMHPDTWETALRAVKEIGIGTIATYLSWRRHEPTPGSFDLRGGHGAELDVHRFLDVCREVGLRVILKPGPWICAEEPGGGFPDWLLADDTLIALDWQGQPASGYNPPFKHPMPSYASTTFRALVSEWIHAVWADLTDYIGPDGPIVGTQYDNEPSLGFQDAMYGFDWHPDALAAWHTFHGSHAEPPRPRTDGPSEATDLETKWANWHRHYIAEYLSWLQGVFTDAGAGHLAGTINLNTHPVRGWPQDGPTIAGALTSTVVGEDHYFIPPLDEEDLTGLALAAAQARSSSTPLRWAPEMQAGIWRSPGELIDYPDPTDTELLGWWAAAIALGYQGFNLYMLVNRENWDAAPVGNDGTLTELGRRLATMLATLRTVPDLDTFAPVSQTQIPWFGRDRVNAYRVRGTQAFPDTRWDDIDARHAYDAAFDAARRATHQGEQFHLDTAPTRPAPFSGVPAGHLVREHASELGGSILFVVRWSRDVTSAFITLSIDETRGWSALVNSRTGIRYMRTANAFVIPAPEDGLDLYRPVATT